MKAFIRFDDRFNEADLRRELKLTLRSHKLADVGDVFWAFGRRHRILAVFNILASDAAQYLFREEGFDSPEAYLEFWGEHHPNRSIHTFMVGHLFALEDDSYGG